MKKTILLLFLPLFGFGQRTIKSVEVNFFRTINESSVIKNYSVMSSCLYGKNLLIGGGIGVENGVSVPVFISSQYSFKNGFIGFVRTGQVISFQKNGGGFFDFGFGYCEEMTNSLSIQLKCGLCFRPNEGKTIGASLVSFGVSF